MRETENTALHFLCHPRIFAPSPFVTHKRQEGVVNLRLRSVESSVGVGQPAAAVDVTTLETDIASGKVKVFSLFLFLPSCLSGGVLRAPVFYVLLSGRVRPSAQWPSAVQCRSGSVQSSTSWMPDLRVLKLLNAPLGPRPSALAPAGAAPLRPRLVTTTQPTTALAHCYACFVSMKFAFSPRSKKSPHNSHSRSHQSQARRKRGDKRSQPLTLSKTAKKNIKTITTKVARIRKRKSRCLGIFRSNRNTHSVSII